MSIKVSTSVQLGRSTEQGIEWIWGVHGEWEPVTTDLFLYRYRASFGSMVASLRT